MKTTDVGQAAERTLRFDQVIKLTDQRTTSLRKQTCGVIAGAVGVVVAISFIVIAAIHPQ